MKGNNDFALSFPSSALLNIFFEMALMINAELENVAFYGISKLLKIKS